MRAEHRAGQAAGARPAHAPRTSRRSPSSLHFISISRTRTARSPGTQAANGSLDTIGKIFGPLLALVVFAPTAAAGHASALFFVAAAVLAPGVVLAYTLQRCMPGAVVARCTRTSLPRAGVGEYATSSTGENTRIGGLSCAVECAALANHKDGVADSTALTMLPGQGHLASVGGAQLEPSHERIVIARNNLGLDVPRES